MSSEPGAHVGTGWNDPELVLSRPGQRCPHQPVGDALISIGWRHLGVLHLDGIVTDQRIHQLRLSGIQGDEEARALLVVLDVHRPMPNANTVRDRYFSPGFRMVDGKPG